MGIYRDEPSLNHALAIAPWEPCFVCGDPVKDTGVYWVGRGTELAGETTSDGQHHRSWLPVNLIVHTDCALALGESLIADAQQANRIEVA